jgi:hypothetical protein
LATPEDDLLAAATTPRRDDDADDGGHADEEETCAPASYEPMRPPLGRHRRGDDTPPRPDVPATIIVGWWIGRRENPCILFSQRMKKKNTSPSPHPLSSLSL